ncbi:MAG: protein translocase SEC61 complex subunit gamma [Nanoarchaeota archaeon]|nr:protein translocase SEC61 complex subunit gamma [Nanoarchaeota archaeon]
MVIKDLWQKFVDFCKECNRVLKVTKKPTNDEFRVIVKASGIGMAIIGAIGFLVQLIKELLL